MALTDLTGTTWVLNDTPNRFSTERNISYNINFLSNNTNYTSFDYFFITSRNSYIEYDNTTVYTFGNSSWANEAYKIISITGGTDATNSTLISWLEANGTLQQPGPVPYTITANITNGTAVHLESEIVPGKSAVLEFKANEGYVLPKTVTVTGASHIWLIESGVGYLTIYDPTDNVNANIVCIEKPRKSVDLTTLAGWSSLSDGSHSITIVAKADGYRDSEPSAAVSVEKSSTEPTEDPFITFTGESSDFTLTATNKEWDGTVEYSTDGKTWTTWDGTDILSHNKKLYLRGSGNTTFYTNDGAQFVLSAKAGCSGNLNTLLEYSNPPTVLSASNCYLQMFYCCTNLTTAPALPATTLAENCYQNMFYGCTSLTTAPALPATTLAENCYQNMFYGCTSLTTAPALPATTLAGRCYSSMFYGCTSLTTAPALPATTLAMYCYERMFYGCSSFKVSSTQTGTYQYAWRIPTSGTISDELGYWNESMLSGTGGTFTSDPSINTTYYVENKPV